MAQANLLVAGFARFLVESTVNSYLQNRKTKFPT